MKIHNRTSTKEEPTPPSTTNTTTTATTTIAEAGAVEDKKDQTGGPETVTLPTYRGSMYTEDTTGAYKEAES